jgi:protein SCO1/2
VRRFVVILLFLGAVAPAWGEEAAASRLAVLRQAPDFRLTAQDGAPLALGDLRGKVVLVSFVFTTCNGSCPVTTTRLVDVVAALDQANLGPERVRLVSVTLDPVRDTPAVLRRYQRQFDIDPRRWSFLTGPPPQVERVLADWGMWTRPLPNGSLDHPSRVFLVDPRGRVREIYNLDFLKPAWVLEDVRLLLGEEK